MHYNILWCRALRHTAIIASIFPTRRPRFVTHQTIIVLDFGSQYTQLIARRLRELSVYSEIWPPDTPAERFARAIRSASSCRADRRACPTPARRRAIRRSSTSGAPVLGICYGMQLMAHALGGTVAPAPQREFGHATVTHRPTPSPLFARRAQPRFASGRATAISSPPRRPASRSSRPARTRRSPRWPTPSARLYALLFHPEVVHTEQRPRDPAQLRLRRLRLHRRLDDGVVCRGGDGADPRAGRRRPRRLRAERRRRFDGRRADHPPRDRRPADLHLRRQRRAAARRGGADPQALRAAAAAAGVRRRVDAVSRPARRRHRSGAEAEDHRRDVHRRVRSRGRQARRRSISSRRARCIRTSSSRCRSSASRR